MKYLLICLLFFLIYWDVQAQSEVRIPKENILQRNPELTSNSLSPEQMQAYTKRAKQKLGDMIDYMKIIINAEHTSERAQAFKQLQNLFWNVPTWAKSIQNLQNYVGKPENFELKSIEITKPLTFTNQNEYKGNLSYHWANKKELMGFVVRKNTKKIGSKEVEVWELFFNP